METKRIFDMLNDQHQFLTFYLKDNLPHIFYRRAFKNKLRHSKVIKQYTMPKKYRKSIYDYWRPYEKINLLWHKSYTAMSDHWDTRYIPEDVFYKKIEPKLNRLDLALAYVDKNMSDQLFSEFKMPKTILRNMTGTFYDADYNRVPLKEARTFLEEIAQIHKFVIKPSIDSGAGKNVRVLDLRKERLPDIRQEISQLFKGYSKDFIVQEYLYQHDLFNQMHKDSLNTIRMISLRFAGEIIVLSSVVRMGDNGEHVDNGATSCITCGITRNHQLKSQTVNHWTYEQYTTHPYSQFTFAETTIPSMKEAMALVQEAHKKLYYFDIVSWDLAIDHLGDPNLIEIGVHSQDINYHQRTNGPLFGKFTTAVLNNVYRTV